MESFHWLDTGGGLVWVVSVYIQYCKSFRVFNASFIFEQTSWCSVGAVVTIIIPGTHFWLASSVSPCPLKKKNPPPQLGSKHISAGPAGKRG